MEIKHFTNEDIKQISSIGLTVEEVERQINVLKKRNLFVHLQLPATPNKGIIVLSEDEINNYVSEFEKKIQNKKLLKFIPASGAATRMFKDLFVFKEEYNPNNKKISKELKQGLLLMEGLKNTAFYDELKQSIEKKNLSIDILLKNKDYNPIIDVLLYEDGLNYASLPKALLLFHDYGDVKRTAVEEHLVEGSMYAKNTDNTAYLHFTISEEHKELFEKLINSVQKKYEEKYGLTYHISFSFQSPTTNTISLTEDNQLFRNEDESLEFRPGGHGSLLENLSDLDADLVFVKNIDNITTDSRKKDTIRYKKILAVLLLNVQKQCFEYLKMLEEKSISEVELQNIEKFVTSQLNTTLPSFYRLLTFEEKQKYQYRLLNRPIRVCGMVKRENEPGGGPFWVVDSKGETSLQIVETSEIDLNNTEQAQHLETSEFFNPVDLACGLKNFKNEKFDLKSYVDKERYFISIKSKNGKTLKALEHPGLWNGSMSDWITLFVAVPLSTFTPVKTVNDLLREEHIEVK